MAGTMENCLMMEGYERDMQTALAVERFRLKNQRLPKHLTELVPEFLPAVPDDPFSNGPLKYELRNIGYVVYSVGPDGQDDHGKEFEKGNSDKRRDVTFTVER